MTSLPAYGELPHYDRLFAAIGSAMAELVNLEDIVHGISLHAAWVADPNISGGRKAWDILNIAIIHQAKLDDKIACARALLFEAVGQCELMDRAHLLFNKVKEHSEKRNRYAHDMWSIDGASLRTVRDQSRMIVHKSGKKLLRVEGAKPDVQAIEQVEALAHEMRATWEELVQVDNELAGLARNPD